jgi:hypothetical protein
MLPRYSLEHQSLFRVYHDTLLILYTVVIIMMILFTIGGKAKSRWRLGMLKVNKLRHGHINVMKLDKYGPTGNV